MEKKTQMETQATETPEVIREKPMELWYYPIDGDYACQFNARYDEYLRTHPKTIREAKFTALAVVVPTFIIIAPMNVIAAMISTMFATWFVMYVRRCVAVAKIAGIAAEKAQYRHQHFILFKSRAHYQGNRVYD